MKEKRDCKIVQDLLPNYIEKLTNEETNLYIEEHLKDCNECQKVLERMRKDIQISENKRDSREVKYIKKYSNKLKILTAVIFIILIALLSVVTYYYFIWKDNYTKAAEALYEVNSEGKFSDVFYATIEDIVDSDIAGMKTIKVKGLEVNSSEYRGEFSFENWDYNLQDDETASCKIKFHGTEVVAEDLQVGQTIAIYVYGDTSENEESLSNVEMIVILDDEL